MLVQSGLNVTLIGAGERLLPRVVAGEVADYLLDHHLMNGLKVVLRASIAAIDGQPDGSLDIVLEDGRAFGADVVLVGIGAVANVELAEAAGLECDNGIVVDELARTSDPAIVAAGDCTNHPNSLVGRRLRLETVHNAVEQGRTAGATNAGEVLPYNQSPWVWSDQYKLRLQSVGIPAGHDSTVMRGSRSAGAFSLFYYLGDRLLAVNCINQPLIFGAVRRILNGRLTLPPELAADPRFDLSQLPPRTTNLEFDVPWPTKFEKQDGVIAWGFA